MGEAAGVGRRVQLRLGAGAALDDVAGALGVSVRELSAVERGDRDLADTELTTFADFVGVSELAILEPDSLLGRLDAEGLARDRRGRTTRIPSPYAAIHPRQHGG